MGNYTMNTLAGELERLDREIELTTQKLEQLKASRSATWHSLNAATNEYHQRVRQNKIRDYDVKFSVKSIQTFLALHTTDTGGELYPVRKHNDPHYFSRTDRSIWFEDYTKKKFDRDNKIKVFCGNLTPSKQLQLQRILSQYFWVEQQSWDERFLEIRPATYGMDAAKWVA